MFKYHILIVCLLGISAHSHGAEKPSTPESYTTNILNKTQTVVGFALENATSMVTVAALIAGAVYPAPKTFAAGFVAIAATANLQVYLYSQSALKAEARSKQLLEANTKLATANNSLAESNKTLAFSIEEMRKRLEERAGK